MANTKAQVITCKAAVCWGSGEPLKVEEIQVEPPKSSEVRVKMLYASLCHTDLLGIKGVYVPLFPRVLGHEGVGITESVGDNVREELKEGDLVIPTYLGECKECENWKSNKTNICLKFPLTLTGVMGDGTSRMLIKGKKLYHFLSCSTWSEYMVVDANYLVKIDSRTPLPHASFLSCGYSTGFGAAWKDADVKKGSTVAVLGLGAVGLGVIEGARIQGAKKIIGVDTNERKREKGTTFGMTDFINPGESEESVSDLIKKLTGGAGVDYTFECTGVPSLANELLNPPKWYRGIGVTTIIGAPPQKSISFNFLPLTVGRTIKGSTFGGIKVQSDLPLLVHKCINKETNIDELFTHEVSLDDINKAFDLMKQVDCVKVLINI